MTFRSKLQPDAAGLDPDLGDRKTRSTNNQVFGFWEVVIVVSVWGTKYLMTRYLDPNAEGLGLRDEG